jgi:hypothetical protein
LFRAFRLNQNLTDTPFTAKMFKKVALAPDSVLAVVFLQAGVLLAEHNHL